MISLVHAEQIHAFYRRDFHPYLNFHCPCGHPERITVAKGKEKFLYRRYATPWETLRALSQALPEGQTYLKPPHRIANQQSDTESARRMQQAKCTLFLSFRQESKSA